MKTSTLKNVAAAIIALGITIPAIASDANSTPVSTDARFTSDQPEVKYLFHHTSEKPYDIKCLSWYGGVMERIVAENKTDKPITVTFEVSKLANGVVAVPAHHAKVTKICEPGKTTTLMDLLSNDGDASLAFDFTHGQHFAERIARANSNAKGSVGQR